MVRVVQKFGGTSVANTECIQNVARKVAELWHEGNEVAVVVSAMAGVTNRLVHMLHEIAPQTALAEHDVVLASGEQVTVGLLAAALQREGVPAQSFLSWQLPITTTVDATNAHILRVETAPLEECFANRGVPIIAGFQGVTSTNRLTTLGRGGSDTTAVAVAAALRADRCDIYTDVDGVYTADPRVVAKARLLESISYEEMLELAFDGAKVLQPRSVETAMKSGVPVRVLSTFSDSPGTTVSFDSSSLGEAASDTFSPVTGITHNVNDARLSLLSIPDSPDSPTGAHSTGLVARVFSALADQGISVDVIVQNISVEERVDLTLTVLKTDCDRALAVLQNQKESLGFSEILFDKDVAKVSIVGAGIQHHVGVAKTMFNSLAEKGIHLQAIMTSDIKISVLVAQSQAELAVQTLHTAYGLDKD